MKKHFGLLSRFQVLLLIDYCMVDVRVSHQCLGIYGHRIEWLNRTSFCLLVTATQAPFMHSHLRSAFAFGKYSTFPCKLSACCTKIHHENNTVARCRVQSYEAAGNPSIVTIMLRAASSTQIQQQSSSQAGLQPCQPCHFCAAGTATTSACSVCRAGQLWCG